MVERHDRALSYAIGLLAAVVDACCGAGRGDENAAAVERVGTRPPRDRVFFFGPRSRPLGCVGDRV